jgi:hypothetical protein
LKSNLEGNKESTEADSEASRSEIRAPEECVIKHQVIVFLIFPLFFTIDLLSLSIHLSTMSLHDRALLTLSPVHANSLWNKFSR